MLYNYFYSAGIDFRRQMLTSKIDLGAVNANAKHTNAISRATSDVGYQTHYLIIAKTYQRDDVRERDRQRDNFQNCYCLVERRAGCRAGFRAGRRVCVWTVT